MKFDIVRAWKDESYRESLSEEELTMLPANPAGELELSDADLESVYGGSVGHGVSLSQAREVRVHSYTLLVCDINLFSMNLLDIKASLINILSPSSQICINND